MKPSIQATIAGHDLEFFADGAVHWPTEDMLLVADTHFGKEATFRKHSIAVPSGSTDATLDRLTQLIDATDAKRLVFLGDLFHARSSLAKPIRDALERFWPRHNAVEFTLVRGNHDAATGRLPSQWPLNLAGSRIRVKDVALEHFPADPPEDCALLMCGHLHPAVRLKHGSDKLGKMSCFWLSGKTLVLPAIGEFTGTAVIRPQKRDRVWVTAGGGIFEYRHDIAQRLGRRQTV